MLDDYVSVHSLTVGKMTSLSPFYRLEQNKFRPINRLLTGLKSFNEKRQPLEKGNMALPVHRKCNFCLFVYLFKFKRKTFVHCKS